MKSKYLDYISKIFLIMLVSFSVALPMFLILDSRKVQIGTIDVQRLVKEHERFLTKMMYTAVEKYPGDQVDLNQQAGIADLENKKFALKLDKAVKKVSEDCKCILLNKAALLTDTTKAKDYTAQVKELIN